MNEIDIVESTMSTDVGDTTANRFRYQWVYIRSSWKRKIYVGTSD